MAKSVRRASRGTTDESCDERISCSRRSVWLREEVAPRSAGGNSTCQGQQPRRISEEWSRIEGNSKAQCSVTRLAGWPQPIASAYFFAIALQARDIALILV